MIDLPTPEIFMKEKKQVSTKKVGQSVYREFDDGNDKTSLHFNSNIDDESLLNETTFLSDEPVRKESKVKNSVV